MMTVDFERTKAAPEIPQPGSKEYFLFLSEAPLQSPTTPEETPGFLLDIRFPQALETFITENKTYVFSLSESYSIYPLTSVNSRNMPGADPAAPNLHARLAPGDRLILHKEIDKKRREKLLEKKRGGINIPPLYSMNIGPNSGGQLMCTAGFNGKESDSPLVVMVVARRISADIAKILGQAELAQPSIAV